MMKSIVLYTDGACSGNPGPGGWGCIIDDMGQKTELSGGEANTTNNRMELTAVIAGIEAIMEKHGFCSIELFSDSKYVLDALQKGWAENWQKNNWRKSGGGTAMNPDLWEKLLNLIKPNKMNYHWVKGHANNPMNNRCDELAVMESKRAETRLLSEKQKNEVPAAIKPDVHFKTTLLKTKTTTEQVEMDENDIFNWLTECTNPDTLEYLGRVALRYAHNIRNGGNDVDPLS